MSKRAPSKASSTKVIEEIDRRLAEAGHRWTKGRRAVVDVFQASSAPLSIPELQAKLGPGVPIPASRLEKNPLGGLEAERRWGPPAQIEVPLSSLYRIISELLEAKVLLKLEFAEGFARFELHEGLLDHHHHLVCIDCGSVADVDLPDLERSLEATTKPIKQRSGFRVADHRLDFFGSCADCTEAAKTTAK